MKESFNSACPLVMHIDLNSCFAIIEQQANPLIRNRPVVVAAYNTPGGFILAASYEAKRLGIKLGLKVYEARQIDPNVIIMMPDPPKYREAYKRFKEILLGYTSEVYPKSIDEFVIDFTGSRAVAARQDLVGVGYEIKQRIKEEIGEYVTVNVGIGPNRFLAKTAAGLNKPDGLDVITVANLEAIYERLTLTDLTGISTRYQARLNNAGIFTPAQFLAAPAEFLAKRVFKSRVGYDWYLRLRGWEVDNVVWGRKSFGHQYALSEKTAERPNLARLLVKLCEKTGRRLRAGGYTAQGVRLSLRFENHTYWSKGYDTKSELCATQDIYAHAKRLLDEAYLPARVTLMSITVYKLSSAWPSQIDLFTNLSRLDKRSVARAMDIINDKYGDFTVFPAVMAGMDDLIIDRIAFGNVRDIG